MSQPPIPLGRRIGEIIEAKGPAFSGRALSKRIGLGKDILYRVINGERYISPSELELVAAGLRMSVQRIKQEDTRKDVEELRRLLQNLEDLERALRIAEKLVSVAIGISERCTMLNYLGWANYELKNYDVAHQHWLKAYETRTAFTMC
ncbi:MAG: helix-turn-helix transcriptional regulator [Tumebacillaceae bacterium]